jgi:hypothetical protein
MCFKTRFSTLLPAGKIWNGLTILLLVVRILRDVLSGVKCKKYLFFKSLRKYVQISTAALLYGQLIQHCLCAEFENAKISL